MNSNSTPTFHTTLIPGTRASNLVQPELRVQVSPPQTGESTIEVDFQDNNKSHKKFSFSVSPDSINTQKLDLSGLHGRYKLQINLTEQGQVIHSHCQSYEIIDSNRIQSGLIDGAWISLVHWSDEEACLFNPALKTATDQDWVEHIQGMHQIGINTVVIQNLFHNNAYVNQHRQTLENYAGESFYPTQYSTRRYSTPAKDPLETILQTTDRLGMNVFLGVGLFAWFDLGQESLRWHLSVTRELYDRYGQHPSLYGWYLPEEMFGDLLDYPSFNYPGCEADIINFFEQYQPFIQSLTPTKPVLFAINNGKFQQKLSQWKEILPYIDILAPFGFARNTDNNLGLILDTCHECGTHLWIDFELFRDPFHDGLRPKDFDAMLQELEYYRQAEFVLGYQYTGLLEHPKSRLKLGEEETRQAYQRYREYYDDVQRAGFRIPPPERAKMIS